MLSTSISNCKTFYTQIFRNMFRHYVFVVLDVLLFSFLKSSFTTLHMLVQIWNIKAEFSSITLHCCKRVYGHACLTLHMNTSTLQYKLQVFSKISCFYNLSMHKKLSKTWTMFCVGNNMCYDVFSLSLRHKFFIYIYKEKSAIAFPYSVHI